MGCSAHCSPLQHTARGVHLSHSQTAKFGGYSPPRLMWTLELRVRGDRSPSVTHQRRKTFAAPVVLLVERQVRCISTGRQLSDSVWPSTDGIWHSAGGSRQEPTAFAHTTGGRIQGPAASAQEKEMVPQMPSFADTTETRRQNAMPHMSSKRSTS